MTTPRAIHADAIVTGDREALLDAAVIVDARGEVLDVGAASDILRAHAGVTVERVRGVVMPGLVNAHTHLELSALRGKVTGGAGFVKWVERMMGVRSEENPEENAEAIDAAIDELDAAATVAVGEVTNSLAAVRALARRGFAGCVFHEVFGVTSEAVRAKIDELDARVSSRLGTWPSLDLAYSPAPHTLYTTHADAVRQLVAAARAAHRMTTLHLAEHASERRALEVGDGPIADWYERMLKLPRAEIAWPRVSPVVYADQLGALAPHVLVVHLADARPDELALVAKRGSPVVLCPRSNLHIETRLPPLLAVRVAGIEAALGTDSLASNASLDVLAEARALADRFPSVPARELVQMATWNGARALGRDDLGRVVKGARPGLVAIDGDVGTDPCAFVLRNVRAPRRFVARRAPERES